MRTWSPALAVVVLLIAAPASARWIVAESANFRVFTQAGEAQAREQAALLEDFDQLLRSLTNAGDRPAGAKLRVFMVQGTGLKTTSPNMGANVAGYYSAGLGGVLAVAERSRGAFGQQVLLHEYAHHFMFKHFNFAYPQWFVEGFAEYMMTARFKPDRIEYGWSSDNRVRWLQSATWLDLKTLLTKRHRDLRADQAAMFYPNSWLLTHYLFRMPGRSKQLADHLWRVGQGEPALDAFERAFATKPAAMQRELERYGTKMT